MDNRICNQEVQNGAKEKQKIASSDNFLAQKVQAVQTINNTPLIQRNNRASVPRQYMNRSGAVKFLPEDVEHVSVYIESEECRGERLTSRKDDDQLCTTVRCDDSSGEHIAGDNGHVAMPDNNEPAEEIINQVHICPAPDFGVCQERTPLLRDMATQVFCTKCGQDYATTSLAKSKNVFIQVKNLLVTAQQRETSVCDSQARYDVASEHSHHLADKLEVWKTGRLRQIKQLLFEKKCISYPRDRTHKRNIDMKMFGSHVLTRRRSCLKPNHVRRKKQIAKTRSAASRIHQDTLIEKSLMIKKKQNHGSSRHHLMWLTIGENSDHRMSDKQRHFYTLQSCRANSVSLRPCFSQAGFSSDRNAQSQVRKIKFGKRRDGSVGQQNHTCAKRFKSVVKKREPTSVRNKSSRSTLIKTKGSRSRLNPRLESERRIGNRLMRRCSNHLAKSELMPCFYLNTNSNAGISEFCPEGGKTETKQPSCTSVHSSDQYFSMHTDNLDGGKVLDSDMEFSQSLSSTDDGMDKIINTRGDLNPNPSKSCNQLKQHPGEFEEMRQNVVQVSSDTTKQRHQPKCMEDADLEDSLTVTNDKLVNEVSQIPTQVELFAHSGNKHKRKTRTTETLYIKFESSMSKKVTTTTVVKDGRKPAVTKQRPDLIKQLAFTDSSQPAITCGPDIKNILDIPRYTKIIRCMDGFHENFENPLRCDTFTSSEDPCQSSDVKGEELQMIDSDHRCCQIKLVPLTGCRQDCHDNGKQMSFTERFMSETSPKKAHSPVHFNDNKHDTIDSDYASEKESSAATIVNMPQTSQVKDAGLLKEARDQPFKNELNLKMDRSRKDDSPKKELYHHQEKKEEAKRITSVNRENSNNRGDRKQELQSQKESMAAVNKESRNECSAARDSTSRKKTFRKQKTDSSLKKHPPDTAVKNDGKKTGSVKVKNKTCDDTAPKEDVGEAAKVKTRSHQTIRKRSPVNAKMASRSPDSKRRRKSGKKSPESKCSNSTDNPKLEKLRKHKINDKIAKKKKKKHKNKVADKANGVHSESVHSIKSDTPTLRTRSTEANKTTQTSSVPTTQFLEVATSTSNHQPPPTHSKGEGSRTALSGDKQQGERVELRSTVKDTLEKSRGPPIRGRAACSAENVSTYLAENKPIRSAESVPTFTGTVYTAQTKVVQVASCPKLRKMDRDLQQAESGWNSSTLSDEERAVIERAKQIQKRLQPRYYHARSKLKLSEGESVAIKPKRLAPRRSQADGDITVHDTTDKSDLEKMKANQAKSVQFLVKTEELVPATDENISERAEPDNDAENEIIVLQPTIKPSMEVPKPPNKVIAEEVPVSSKSLVQKKEETSRSLTTPPRKRRPIWIRKATKDKPATNAKTNNATKSVPALVPLKQRQSSENILKPTSRINFQIYYPLKSKTESPIDTDLCLEDNTTVAYNTWINGSSLTAPMNKATKKLVAKTGSPVDIREIIEGSSVDGSEYYRQMRAGLDMAVRAAKSVPFLNSHKLPVAADVATSKRTKMLGEPRSLSHKKTKDVKAGESGSMRSLASIEDEHSFVSKTRAPPVEISPASSTDVDTVGASKQKSAHNRFMGQTPSRKRDKKQAKKATKSAGKWHLVKAQDAHSVPDLTRMQYYGDTMELNALNTGLSWMVHNVFRRLPFLGHRQSNSVSNASGDMLSLERSSQ